MRLRSFPFASMYGIETLYQHAPITLGSSACRATPFHESVESRPVPETSLRIVPAAIPLVLLIVPEVPSDETFAPDEAADFQASHDQSAATTS